PEASMSTTSDPESEEVMKKIATRMIAITEKTAPRGRFPSASKSTASTFRLPSSFKLPAVRSALVNSCWKMPTPPSTENQMTPTIVGTSSTPATNCRIVRPREIRAMNTPTNGDQEIHQPQ